MSRKWARRNLQEAAPLQPFTEPLQAYIPRVSPRLVAPTWLEPLTDLLEEALVKPICAVVAAPPQHGKTECITHALTRAMRVKPSGRSAYATYNAKRSARVERKTRLIAERSGLEHLRFRQDDWFDPRTGGGLLWASRKGGLTGEPIDTLLIVDDILKDRREADSAAAREECLDWFDDVAEPRCHPTASKIVVATRWHPKDLSGELIARGWRYLNLKALAEGTAGSDGRIVDDPLHRFPGEALCEERRSREAHLAKRKVNLFSFVSLYQGEPRPRGGTVFGEPAYYDALPAERYRVGYGVDLAYSSKKSADHSVCIELWRHDPAPDRVDTKPKPVFYVVAVARKQVAASEFTLTLHSMRSKRRGPMRWYASGTEAGAADFIKRKVAGLQVEPATQDKFIRAQPVSEAWNDGRVLLPSARFFGQDEDDDSDSSAEPEWVAELASEVQAFTGLNDPSDDQVDALAAAYDVLASSAAPPSGGRPVTPGTRWDNSQGRGFG